MNRREQLFEHISDFIVHELDHSDMSGPEIQRVYPAITEFCVKNTIEHSTEQLHRFFFWFRENGEKHIGISVEKLIIKFLEEDE